MKRTVLFFLIAFSIHTLKSQDLQTANIHLKNTEDHTGLFNKNEPVNEISFSNRKKDKKENDLFKKLFIKFYGGYGFFTPGSYSVSSSAGFQWYSTDYISHDTSVKTQAERGIGAGLRLGFGIGLVQNDFLNFGIDAEYQHQNTIENSINIFVDSSNYAFAHDEMSYTAITLTPHVTFKALARPKFFLYNKLGILV